MTDAETKALLAFVHRQAWLSTSTPDQRISALRYHPAVREAHEAWIAAKKTEDARWGTWPTGALSAHAEG